MKPITLGEVEQIAHVLAKRLMSWDEPIPDFGTRRPNILEGTLLAPMQTFGKKPLYKGVVPKAAILFYLIIKDHPFINGNKRIAVTTLLVFLDKNGYWLRVDPVELYNFAKWVAASNPKLKRDTVRATETFLKAYIEKSRQMPLFPR